MCGSKTLIHGLLETIKRYYLFFKNFLNNFFKGDHPCKKYFFLFFPDIQCKISRGLGNHVRFALAYFLADLLHTRVFWYVEPRALYPYYKYRLAAGKVIHIVPTGDRIL